MQPRKCFKNCTKNCTVLCNSWSMVTLSTLFNSPSTLMRSALLSPQYGGKKRDLVKLWKGASPVAQQWRIHLQCRSYRRCRFDPWVKNIPWRKKWQLTPVFLLQNPMDRGAWRLRVHGVAKSWTRLNNFTHSHTGLGKKCLKCLLRKIIMKNIEKHCYMNLCLWLGFF